MAYLTIDTAWTTFMAHIFLWLCSMVAQSHQTATFQTSLFPNPAKKSNCPESAVQKAMACTAKLKSLSMTGPMLNQNIPLNKSLEDACVEGNFFDALNCIERVMLDCRHDISDGAHFLRTNINIENTRRSIVYFCTNLKTYLYNLECIKNSQQSITECGHDAKMKFMGQVRATSNQDALMRFQCPFYNTAINCVKSVLKARCNKETSNLVFTVMAGFEPPICSKSIYTVNNMDNSDTLDSSERPGSSDRQQDHQDKPGNGSGSLWNHFVVNCVCFVVILLHGQFSVRR